MTKTNDLQRYLNNHGVTYQIIDHEPAASTRAIAEMVHVPAKDLAKTVVVHIDGKVWMTVIRADNRLNTRFLKRLFGAHDVHLAHEEDLSTLFPDCQLGMMPPFGNLYGIPVIVDRALTSDEEIVFNACSATKAIRMKFNDYEQLVSPVIGRFAEPPFRREDEW